MRLFALLLAVLAACARAADPERPPAVAGSFYPADQAVLKAQVDRFLGDAKQKHRRLKGKVLALVVPHAGLQFSGRAAAAAYDAVDPAGVDIVVMVAAAHRLPVRGAALYPGAYGTPLGAVPYDKDLGEALTKASSLIRPQPEAHEGEHSIEVNAPFVRRRFPKARLVGLLMNADDLETAQAVGEALAKAVAGRKALLVASSDLSHYPPGAIAQRVDSTTLHALASLDPAFFYSVNRFWMSRNLTELKCTYCGEAAVTAVLAAARALGADKAELLERYHSGDTLTPRDDRAVVGYAAVAFLKGSGAPARTAYGLSAEDRKLLLREARETLRLALDGKPPKGEELSARPAFNLPAAVFVTLNAIGPKHEKTLRGCIGSLEPQGSLIEAVRQFALAAGFHDGRFRPLERSELDGLRIELSILSPRRRVATPAEIRAGKDGATVEQDGHFGVFLPQVWESLPARDDFLGELCSQKAGLPRDCASDPKTRVSAFTVESFEEDHLPPPRGGK